MLDPKVYIADWEDFPYPNFISFLNAVSEKYADRTAILYREGKRKEFDTWTYARYGAECRRIARGLLAAGLKKGDRVALWCENRPEWMVVWMGAVIAGCAIVPVDIFITEEDALNIIRLTEAKAVFLSRKKARFSEELRSGAGGVTAPVVNLCFPGEDYGEFGREAGEIALPGEESVAGDDVCSIVFTSGTTGFAKGVMLSHRGIISNTSAAVLMLRPMSSDTFISVLPLHHTYPTTCSFIAPLAVGAPVIIVERLVGQVVIDDIRDGRGTFLIAVPVLYDKVMAGISAKYKKLPLIVRLPLDLLRAKALKEAKKGNPEFGRKVFRFLRRKAGLDSIVIMVAGGGALNPRTADFFDSLGFNIVHGYGMSENSPLISVSTPEYKNNVSVGLPVKYTDVRIVSQDDDSRALPQGESGEIVVRSPSVMLGYYGNPEATAEAFTKDGYLKTGDLGFRDKDGFIYINGRRKNLIVSSGGKNIYPEEIETKFCDSRVISEILVTGRREAGRTEEFVFAVVCPAFENLKEDYPDKAGDGAFVRHLVRKEIESVNRKLPAYKKIAGFMLRDTGFEKNAQGKIRRFLYKDYGDAAKTPADSGSGPADAGKTGADSGE